LLTAFGVTVLTLMMITYALERRHRGYVLAFAGCCALAGLYGFLSGAWPFGVIEEIWCLIAVKRFLGSRGKAAAATPGGTERS
jgi:hypothetical protein